jgi:hypothetical protein
MFLPAENDPIQVDEDLLSAFLTSATSPDHQQATIDGGSLGSISNAGYVDVTSSAVTLGDDPLVYPTMDKKVHLSPLEMASIELLSLCDSAGACHDFYDELLALLCCLRNKGVDITKGKRWDTLAMEMRKKVNVSNPLAMDVAGCTIIYFPFIDMLCDLLRSSKFSNVANLCVNQNVEDWFKHSHPSSLEDYSEMMSRNWANATLDKLLETSDFNPLTDFFLSLLFYPNKTGTNGNKNLVASH